MEDVKQSPEGNIENDKPYLACLMLPSETDRRYLKTTIGLEGLLVV